jgi:hypothetical protein
MPGAMMIVAASAAAVPRAVRDPVDFFMVVS